MLFDFSHDFVCFHSRCVSWIDNPLSIGLLQWLVTWSTVCKHETVRFWKFSAGNERKYQNYAACRFSAVYSKIRGCNASKRTHLREGIKVCFIKEILSRPFKNCQIKGNFKENHSDWLGGKGYFSHTDPSNFGWPLYNRYFLKYMAEDLQVT